MGGKSAAFPAAAPRLLASYPAGEKGKNGNNFNGTRACHRRVFQHGRRVGRMHIKYEIDFTLARYPMPVERIGQYLEFRNCGVTPALGIESSNLDACVAEILRRNWQGAFGCPVFGFEEIDLDFLAKMPHLIQVWFWQVELQNIDGLYALPDLKYFGVHPNRPELDFSRLPNLETMVWFHNRKDKHVEALSNLAELNVWHFKPKSKSFAELKLPQNLKSMRLYWANPNSLEDLPVLSSLRHIEFHRCRNLASLASLERIAPALESVIVSTCGKLQGESFVPAIPSLRKVVINDRQIVG